MKRLIKFLLFGIIYINICIGCKDTVDDDLVIYPVNLDVSDFSLTGTNCNWNWQTFQKDSFVVINSKEEFVARIICQDDNVPAIDFEKHSLLFTWGSTTSGVHSISKHLKQTSKNDYQLSIDVILNDATVAEGWRISILTPKLSSTANIVVDVNQHY
jgi:hypothetical protein